MSRDHVDVELKCLRDGRKGDPNYVNAHHIIGPS
jgi:hypothetical protein